MKRKTDSEIEAAAIEAAFSLFAERGYRDVRLIDIAARAGCDLGDLRRCFDGKTAILARFLLRIDAAILADDPDFGEEESVRDRLFDLLMRRFDALQPHRDALAAIRRDLPGDPALLIEMAPQGLRAMAWYLEAAGESADGVVGALRIKGLAAVWLHCLRIWFDDGSEDLAKTMAALDKALTQAERAARWLPSLKFSTGRGAAEDVDRAQA